ncbi:MAG: ribonuclease H-like YkuK family protein, partial [Patescibacteria group bacterium]
MADFNNITNGKVGWKGLGREIRSFVSADLESEYKLIIGSDSRSRDLATGKPGIDLVTAVVIHRKGRGGRYFWKKNKVENIYSLKEKLYQETLASLK